MPIPMAVARFNRYVTNPLARLVAGRLPGLGILRHRGRRTGRRYSTPLNVFAAGAGDTGEEGGFVIALTYGPGTDWMANVLHEGACTIRHRGQDIALHRPTRISEEEGMAAMPAPVRVALRLLGVTEFLRLERAS